MKVGFYNHTGVVSGAEISLLLTAKHLKRVRPVIFAPRGELTDRAREAELPVVEIPGCRARLTHNPIRLLWHFLRMGATGYRFALAVRRHRIDVIHANSLRAGIMAALFAWLHRRPVVWHIRDMPPGGIVGKAVRVLAAMTAHAVVGISNSVLQAFDRRALSERLHLVHNGVELRAFSKFEKKRWRMKIREELGTPPNAKVLAVIGQIAPWKRQADALRAAERLLERGHDVYLWVVGEAKFRKENAAYLEALRRLASRGRLQGRVKFTGFRHDVMEICCAADLLLLCSDQEPFGRVLIEAMAVSTPVVATNAGGVPEIVEHGKSGLLYEVGDVSGLVRHAELLLAHENARLQMGLEAEARVRALFTIERTADKIEQVYMSMMARLTGRAARKIHVQREKKVHDAEM